MKLSKRSRLTLAAVALTIAGPVGFSFAQGAGTTDLQDFVHYVNIAKPDLAKAHIQKLFDSGISDADLAEMVDSSIDEERFDMALRRARVILGLEDIAAQLETRVESGRRDLARDEERINRAIEMLIGTQRQKALGQERLQAAGEYAVPALLSQMIGNGDPQLRLRCREMLVSIGRLSVTPLCAALLSLDDESQVKVCEILARIKYPHATPYLLELADDAGSPGPVREAAAKAFSRIGGGDESLSDQYAMLGGRYLIGEQSLVAYPTEATNNVWGYDSFTGLHTTPVATEIFTEVMAMQATRHALSVDSGNTIALSLYVAANLKRENDLPDGASDPVFGEADYSPSFYAMAAGTGIMQSVLGFALDSEDTPLVRDAIEALSSTTGGSNLWMGAGNRRPLLEALNYPDRRVRYEAALALGKAQPEQGFSGDFAVVPLLASAVRAGDATYALVIADSEEDQQTYDKWLEDLDYEVVATASSLAEADLEIARAAGIDAIIVRQSQGNAISTVGGLRTNPKTSVAPVLVLGDGVEVPSIRNAMGGDRRVKVLSAGISQSGFASALEDAIQTASGGRIDEGEAQLYAIDALATLRDIAINGRTVYNVADAQTALIDALALREGGTRRLVAEVLSRIDGAASQRAIFDAALSSTGREQAELLRLVAESAKRFGNMAEPRHASQLRALIEAGGDAAEAAARVYGAINEPTSEVVKLIID